MLKEITFAKSLKNRRIRLEGRQRVLNSLLPFGVRQIAPERNPATAPAERRKAAHFQEQLPIFLTELRGLAPILNFKARDDGVLWQWRRIKQPGVGNRLL